jgi:hypothetical protein
MPEPEPELQATANLSPVSPAPVHTAPALAVPALQDTVDTIDAMVAAALAPNGTAAADEPIVDPDLVPTGDDNDDVVDDDSFNDAYAEDNAANDAASAAPQEAQPEDADDYARTFDSPTGSEKGEDDDTTQDAAISESTHQQNDGPASSTVQGSISQSSDIAADHSSSDAATVPQVQNEAAPSTSAPQSSPQDGQPVEATPKLTNDGSLASQTHDDAADIKRLVADLTSQPSETSPSSDIKTTQLATGPAAPSTNLPSSALPSPSSLPPRPPIPHNTPSYPEQHHPGQPPASAAAAQVPPPTHAQAAYSPTGISGAPGGGLVAPGVSHIPPSYQTQAPGYPTERPQEDDYQRKWDQFLADERQYMTEAKWDRFPEGSRIFIGMSTLDS